MNTMRKLFYVFAFSVILVGCNGLFNGQKMIMIKGQISSPAKSNAQRVKSVSPTLADATKVLIFYGNKYILADIKNGSFTSQAPMGSATCLVFLDANNQFIGNLFAGGLNLLPLVSLSNGENTQIDLSTLTLDGTHVIPANDPIGNQIKLSADEITYLQEVGAYYESLAKNIDTDNDGQPDMLSGTNLLVNTQVDINVGKFGLNETPPTLNDTSQFVVNYGLQIMGKSSMNTNKDLVRLTGPEDDPYTNLVNSWYVPGGDDFIFVFKRGVQSDPGPYGTTFLPFKDGKYTFWLTDTKNLTFNYSNVNMRNHMVIINPTLHTNNQGQVTSIDYAYQMPNGSSVNPRDLIMSYIRIQIDNNTNSLYQSDVYDYLYGSDNLTAYNYYTKQIDKPVQLTNITQIKLAYLDLLGNEYQFIWKNQ